MTNTHFTKDHEWVRVDGDIGTVGITDHAQSQLGDIVYVELPEVGKRLTKGDAAAVVESVKAASEVFAPMSGEVIAVNSELEGAPATVNEDPVGKGWFFQIKLGNPGEAAELLSAEGYADYVESVSRSPIGTT